MLSSWALIAAYLVFLGAGSFGALLVGQLLIALAMTLRSGTDTALHYDSLVALNRVDEFAQREAVAEILSADGWRDIVCVDDYAGHPRMTTARLKASNNDHN